MSDDILPIPFDKLETFSDLTALWKKLFTTDDDNTVPEIPVSKKEWIHEALDNLQKERGMIVRIPEDDFDIAFVNNIVWTTGFLCQDTFRRFITPTYGCRDGWCVSTRLYVGPMIFLRRSLLEGVNEISNPTPPHKFKVKVDARSRRNANPYNSFRGSCWDGALFNEVLENTKIIDATDKHFSPDKFFDNTWMPPRIEFMAINSDKDPLLASVLVPSVAIDGGIRIKTWGFVSTGIRNIERVAKKENNVELGIPEKCVSCAEVST